MGQECRRESAKKYFSSYDVVVRFMHFGHKLSEIFLVPLTISDPFYNSKFHFSVGVDADEEKLGKVISELSGKNIDEVLAEGKIQMF